MDLHFFLASFLQCQSKDFTKVLIFFNIVGYEKTISQENINNIEFITGERDTLIFYYKDDNKERKAKTWYISTIANVNGDIYDYFINVSKLRGKSAIDSYIIIKAKRNK